MAASATSSIPGVTPEDLLLIEGVRAELTANSEEGTYWRTKAMTSFDRAVSFLGISSWKWLHSFTYVIFYLVALHSLYNHFLVQPLLATALIVLVFPWVSIAVFQHSERETQTWLGAGFDTDQELLKAVHSGQIAATPVGSYLKTLRSRFAAEVIVDMMCLLRLRAELAIRAKGVLMMREAGFAPKADPAVQDKFEELRYLEKSIGTTGMLAIGPFLHTRTRDLWQLNMLRQMEMDQKGMKVEPIDPENPIR